ncbi:hypothetical protein HYH03_017924 [Edaphochlamys debaryana]|uniref:Uncharacterized protein n=1 Tax=Edaphochlamys debaryana TaxID=47281 RepID=A0A836BPX7_9CHLO|nr:hypothetical protein HYH03_017924 [Edaphochlamys debaryana]|eukprot:KAG2483189.1 hypothetical protein HYH03_017924 [Edaphochlamys debaryana]
MMAASALASSLLKGGGAGGHSGDLHSPPRRQAGGGGYLPLDTVHVSPRRISPAKLRQRWGVACRACNGLLMALGLWLAATSWGGSGIPYSVGAQATGLGLAISALGGVGLFAGGSEALGLRTLLLVGLGGSAVGTLDLMRQVGRDVSTHCSLAEVSAHVRHVESALEKMKHDELITQLFFRMNEMDDMLGMVTQSAAATAEGHSAVWRAAQADRDYLRAKATALRRHAASVAESLKGRIEAGKVGLSRRGAWG